MAKNKTVIAEILRTARRLTTAPDALLAGFGMTSAKIRLLKTIRRLPVPFTISALARLMDVSRQAARDTVRDLEAAGLISVALDPRNRKAHIVVLTPLGRIQLEEMLRIEESWVTGLTHGLADRTLSEAAWLIRIVRERVATFQSASRHRARRRAAARHR